jgi:hypothetical protein
VASGHEGFCKQQGTLGTQLVAVEIDVFKLFCLSNTNCNLSGTQRSQTIAGEVTKNDLRALAKNGRYARPTMLVDRIFAQANLGHRRKLN